MEYGSSVSGLLKVGSLDYGSSVSGLLKAFSFCRLNSAGMNYKKKPVDEKKKKKKPPRKNKKPPRPKKNKTKAVIQLFSTAGTGFFYVMEKANRFKEMLEFRKFDPLANRHVLFTEVMKKLPMK